MKIVSRNVAAAAEPASSSSVEEWRPNGCPPPADATTGASSLAATGPCTFQQQRPASCVSVADHFVMTIARKAANNATLMMYINVDGYHGPGSYEGAEIFAGVQDATSVSRWSTDDAKITVGPGEAYSIIPATELDAEGAEASGANSDPGGTADVISGTLACDTSGKK